MSSELRRPTADSRNQKDIYTHLKEISSEAKFRRCGFEQIESKTLQGEEQTYASIERTQFT
jgi:hypothetical protein